MARRGFLTPGVGEHLLTTKLLILNGTHRPSSSALSMLTGKDAVLGLVVPDMTDVPDLVDVPGLMARDLVFEATVQPAHRGRHFAARTVYLSDRHLADVDRIADAWQSIEPRRLSRSAVVRQAVEHLYAAVKADPAKSMLENE